MALGITNRTATASVREVTPGVTPNNPVFANHRVVSNGLKPDIATVKSAEIRADRQIVDLIQTGIKPGGDIDGELAFESWAPDLEEVLRSAWVNKPSITVATADTEISDVSTTVVTVASGGAAFKTGALVLISGMPTAGNNKLATLLSSTATALTFASSTFTAESAAIPVGAAVRVVGFQGTSGDIAATTTGGNALTSTTLDFTTFGLAVGERVLVGDRDAAGTSFATAACNGWCRISAIAAHRLSFDDVPTGFTADTGTGKTISVFAGDMVTNGTAQTWKTIEVQQQGIAAPVYEYYRGALVSKVSVSVEAQKVATIKASHVALSWASSTSRASGASDTIAPAYGVLNAATNVGRLFIGATAIGGVNPVTKMSVDIDNNSQGQAAVGSLGFVGVQDGEFSVTGSLTTYFGDDSYRVAANSNAISGVSTRLGRADGNREAIGLEIPKIKFTMADAPIAGANQSRMISGGWQGLASSFGWTIAVQRWWYLPVANA